MGSKNKKHLRGSIQAKKTPLGHYTGLGQYNGLGEYCDPHTGSPVFLILVCIHVHTRTDVCACMYIQTHAMHTQTHRQAQTHADRHTYRHTQTPAHNHTSSGELKIPSKNCLNVTTHRSKERGVLGVGSIPVAILSSCQDIKLLHENCIYMN